MGRVTSVPNSLFLDEIVVPSPCMTVPHRSQEDVTSRAFCTSRRLRNARIMIVVLNFAIGEIDKCRSSRSHNLDNHLRVVSSSPAMAPLTAIPHRLVSG